MYCLDLQSNYFNINILIFVIKLYNFLDAAVREHNIEQENPYSPYTSFESTSYSGLYTRTSNNGLVDPINLSFNNNFINGIAGKK